MYAMPTVGWLIDHALLHCVHPGPGSGIGASKPYIFTAIGKTSEAFVGNAYTLVESIGAGMAKAAMHHIPTVQASTSRQSAIPDKGIEASHGTIMINQGKELL